MRNPQALILSGPHAPRIAQRDNLTLDTAGRAWVVPAGWSVDPALGDSDIDTVRIYPDSFQHLSAVFWFDWNSGEYCGPDCCGIEPLFRMAE